jgi:hypothetical protein
VRFRDADYTRRKRKLDANEGLTKTKIRRTRRLPRPNHVLRHSPVQFQHDFLSRVSVIHRHRTSASLSSTASENRQAHDNLVNTVCQDARSQRYTRYCRGRRTMPLRHPGGIKRCNSKNTCDSSKVDHDSGRPTQLVTAWVKRLLVNAIKIRSMDGLFPKLAPVNPSSQTRHHTLLPDPSGGSRLVIRNSLRRRLSSLAS